MVATPIPNPYQEKNSTNVRTPSGSHLARPRTVPASLNNLLDWFIGFVGIGLTEEDVNFTISRAEIDSDLSTGRDD